MPKRRAIAFLMDNNVPDSVTAALVQRGHDVVRVRDIMAADCEDPVVAEAAIRTGRVLVSWDRDFNHQRYLKPRFAALHRIGFSCPELEGADRIRALMGRIEFEFSLASPMTPMLVKISRDRMQVRC